MGIEDKPKPETDFATISVKKETKQRILQDKLEFAQRMKKDISYDDLILVMSEITRKMPWLNKRDILEKFYKEE